MNFKRIIEAQEYYEKLGYKYIETPWATDWDVNLQTAPESAKFYVLDDKLLVASGEQSFIQLMKENRMPEGKYQTITPCFRDDKLDKLHQRYFMKLELIDAASVDVLSMMHDSWHFFERHISIKMRLTNLGYDIVDSLNEVELGSYGLRHTKYGSFIYGTGCAEPRLTTAINMLGV